MPRKGCSAIDGMDGRSCLLIDLDIKSRLFVRSRCRLNRSRFSFCFLSKLNLISFLILCSWTFRLVFRTSRDVPGTLDST